MDACGKDAVERDEFCATGRNWLCLSFAGQREFLPVAGVPLYPNAAVNCPRGPVSRTLPASWQQYATSEISAFAPDIKTPRVQQASLSLERELPSGLTGTLSYLLVHGVGMIRARDVNLPPPTYYSYPILNSAGNSVSESVL